MANRMTRRGFIKTLGALAGVSLVPALGVSLPSVPEPVKWGVEMFDFDMSIGVAAQWAGGIRHAVCMDNPRGVVAREKAVELCKQALRQWYHERHVLRKAA